MTNCDKCQSERVVFVGGLSAYRSYVLINAKDDDNYIPSDFGLGEYGAFEFNLCLNCGKIQGQFPRPMTPVER